MSDHEMTVDIPSAIEAARYYRWTVAQMQMAFPNMEPEVAEALLAGECELDDYGRLVKDGVRQDTCDRCGSIFPQDAVSYEGGGHSVGPCCASQPDASFDPEADRRS